MIRVPTARRIFDRLCKTTFATVSAITGSELIFDPIGDAFFLAKPVRFYQQKASAVLVIV
jgi:hypothetical protein